MHNAENPLTMAQRISMSLKRLAGDGDFELRKHSWDLSNTDILSQLDSQPHLSFGVYPLPFPLPGPSVQVWASGWVQQGGPFELFLFASQRWSYHSCEEGEGGQWGLAGNRFNLINLMRHSSERLRKYETALENKLAVHQTAKQKIIIWPSNSALLYLPESTENTCSHKNLYTKVHNGFIHGGQKVEVTPMFTSWWMDKHHVVYPYNKWWPSNKWQ